MIAKIFIILDSYCLLSLAMGWGGGWQCSLSFLEGLHRAIKKQHRGSSRGLNDDIKIIAELQSTSCNCGGVLHRSCTEPQFELLVCAATQLRRSTAGAGGRVEDRDIPMIRGKQYLDGGLEILISGRIGHLDLTCPRVTPTINLQPHSTQKSLLCGSFMKCIFPKLAS